MKAFINLFATLCFAAPFLVPAVERPNILWITSEDNGISWVSCYGSTNAKTPAIDQLAKEGFRYTHCFDNAGSLLHGIAAIGAAGRPIRRKKCTR